MSATCKGCGRPIPPERLEALPEATRCVECVRAGGDPRVRGRNVYDHKTGGSAEVLSAEQFQAAKRAEESVEERVSRL